MPTTREAEGRCSRSRAPRSAPAGRRAAMDSGPDPAAHRSDQELVDGILVSDESCFNELYERYFNRVYAYSYRRVRNHGDAEEITQEAFVSVFKSISGFRGQSSLISWIYGITRNLSNNSLRRFHNQREKFGSVSPDYFAPNTSLGDCDPDEELSMRRYVEAIRSQMDQLPNWQRRVFEMRHLENMPISRIAEETQRSSDAVRSSLYRIKRMIFETADRDPRSLHV